MKIYEIRWHTGENSWICANTAIEALKVYCAKKDTNFDEFDGMDDIVVLSKLKWGSYKTRQSQTFRQYMRTAVIPDVISESFLNITSNQQKTNNKNELGQIFRSELILLQGL